MGRRIIFWILSLLFIGLFVTRVDLLEELAATLLQAKWYWILAAAALQSLYFLLYTKALQNAFAAVDIPRRLGELLPVLLGALFINTVTPAGGAAGVALIVDDASRRGYAAMKATTAMMLQLIGDFSSVSLLLLGGGIILYQQGLLQPSVVAGGSTLFLITAGLVSLILLGWRKPQFLQRIFRNIQRLINMIILHILRRLSARVSEDLMLPQGWGERMAGDFVDASQAIVTRPMYIARNLFFSLLAHTFSILALGILFINYGKGLPPGYLIAGYAVMILTWALSPLPQGTGIIEGTMALFFSSLGVIWEHGLAVILAFRALSFWIPLVIGFFMLRRVQSFAVEPQRKKWEGHAKGLAAAVFGMGLFNLLSALKPQWVQGLNALQTLSPLYVQQASLLSVVITGFAFLMLSRGLWRGKVAAWVITLGLSIGALLSHLMDGLYLKAALAFGLALWLGLSFTQFYVRSDWIAIKRALRLLMFTFLITLAAGSAGMFVFQSHFQSAATFPEALLHTFVLYTQFVDQGLQTNSLFAQLYTSGISLISAVTFGYALIILDRPVRLRRKPSEVEKKRAEEIVQRYGSTSMAYLTLMEDKTYFFSPGGSLVAYTVWGRVALALADPIGPSADIRNAVTHFVDYCRINDWIPSFCLTQPDYLDIYAKEGFKALCLGYEAIVDLKSFNLRGRARSNYRKRYHRFIEEGYSFMVHTPPIDAALLDEMQKVSDEWLEMNYGVEKRFFLGWFDRDYLRKCHIAAVYDPSGKMTAFANLIPEYQRNEATIDLMRRRKRARSGTMDFMFVSLFFWAREQGYDTFNMGLCALAGVGEEPGAPLVERMINLIYHHINRFYNFKGIHDFKMKFKPKWVPQYLVYTRAIDLPTVWFAMVRANTSTR